MAVLQKIAMDLMWKVLTTEFAAKMIVHGLRLMADNTENQVDDAIVSDVAAALGVAEG